MGSKLLALLTLAVAGCSWTGGGEELRDGAGSLVPPGGRVLEERVGDCTTLGRAPNCMFVFLEPDGASREARTARFDRTARAGGWRAVDTSVLPGGTEIYVERDGLKARIRVLGDVLLDNCDGVADDVERCADQIYLRLD